MELHDAPQDFHQGRGAMIRMILPAVEKRAGDEGGAADHGELEKATDNGI
jgi:two-component system nitrogen regulation sensor histidine kinase NtrY